MCKGRPGVRSMILYLIKHYWIAIVLCTLIIRCQRHEARFTGDQLVNTIAFAAYPHHTGHTTPELYNEIYIIKVEPGATPRRVTSNKYDEAQPIWMDGGQSLVFLRCIGRVGSYDSRFYLYKTDLLDMKEERLLEVSRGIEIKAHKNLYVLEYSDPTTPLYYLDKKSDSLVKILNAENIGISISPTWSGIWDFSVDEKESKFALTITDGIRIKIKNAREKRKRREIAIVNRDGTDLRILTNDTFPDFSPTISPNGEFIAFESERNGNGDIYLMNITTKELKRLTSHPARDYIPAWSLDGKHVAFVSRRDGFAHIWVINADGTGLYQLTRSDFHVHRSGIVWSPR